jgi:hypothetical protein
MRVVTSDLREAIAAVSQVYCPHDVTVLESNRGIDAVLETSGASRRRIVNLRYAAPVRIDAGTLTRNRPRTAVEDPQCRKAVLAQLVAAVMALCSYQS